MRSPNYPSETIGQAWQTWDVLLVLCCRDSHCATHHGKFLPHIHIGWFRRPPFCGTHYAKPFVAMLLCGRNVSSRASRKDHSQSAKWWLCYMFPWVLLVCDIVRHCSKFLKVSTPRNGSKICSRSTCSFFLAGAAIATAIALISTCECPLFLLASLINWWIHALEQKNNQLADANQRLHYAI